jgi:hypothetical protein
VHLFLSADFHHFSPTCGRRFGPMFDQLLEVLACRQCSRSRAGRILTKWFVPEISRGTGANANVALSTGVTVKQWGVGPTEFDGDWASAPDDVAEEYGALQFDLEPRCQDGIHQTTRVSSST